VAPLVAQLILKQGLAGRNTYTFKLGWEYCLLEPMDFVTLTDAGLGLFKFPVRIVSVEEDDEGTLTITAQEYVAGSGSAPTYAVQTSAPFTPNQNVAPGSINTPIIFEPSSSLTNGDPEVWMVASGDVNYGSNQVWVSTDGGVNYGQVGTMPSQCRQGVLTAILPAPSGGNPDTASTLAVDLTESAGQLLTASVAAATALPPSTLCYADGELLAYATATLLTTSAYDLTYLERGLYGTAAAAHAAGTQFARLDDSVFKYSLPQSYVGQTLHVKFLAINPLGNSAQTLADATDYTFTPTGVGYTIAPPTSPTLAPVTQAQGSGIAVQGLALTWGASAGPLLGSYAVQWSTDGGVTWPGSGTAPAGATQFIISPVVASTSYIARVAAVSQNGRAVSAWAATGSTASGVSGGLSAIANNTILGNNAGVSASPSAISASAVLDMVGSVQGDILYRGSGGWAVLAPSTAGKLLATGGTGANPSWVSGNAGTVTSVGLSMPSPFTVGSSPVTGAGTLTVTMSSVGTGAIVLQSYVDAAIQGLSIKPTATMATSAALPANSYSNGTSGVGATLTGTATGVLTVDGIAAILGAIVLVKNEAAAANDGLYTVTTAGAVGVAYVLTRHVDMDQSAEFSGGFVAVDAGGTANANSLWLCNPSGAVTVGTTAIPFTQLNGATDLVQGSGITISGNAVSISTSYVGQTSITTLGTIATGTWQGSVVGLTFGGTGAALTASNGGLVYSTASALGVLAGTATAGRIVQSGASSAPSWSTATYPAAAGTAGQVLRSNGTNFLSAALAAADLSNGTSGPASGLVVLGTAPATWTPTITIGGGAASLTVNNAVYTQIGKLVTASFDIQISSLNSHTGAVTLTGLPWICAANGSGPVTLDYISGAASTLNAMPSAFVPTSTTTIQFVKVASGTTSNLLDTDITSALRIIGTAIYFTP